MPKNRLPRQPKLRRHSNGGAFVEINGRRIHLRAPCGSKLAQQKYDKLMAIWLSNGRELPPNYGNAIGLASAAHEHRPTVINLLLAYLRWAEDHYGPSPALEDVKYAMRPLKKLYGYEPADEFGPRKLIVLRDGLIRDGNWNRETINQRIGRMKAIFKWGVAQEIVNPSVWKSLDAVDGLRAGRSDAREPGKVHAVALDIVEATIPFLSSPVAGLVRLQLATAARGGELFGLCPLDIDMSDSIWKYSPSRHKGTWRGKKRTIYIGPVGQDTLKPLLSSRSVDAPFFKPSEAGSEAAKVALHDCYDKNSYRIAIGRACDKAFPPLPHLQRQRVPATGRKSERWETAQERQKRLGDEGIGLLKNWRKEHRWHPHQLRHTALTFIERSHGLEAARLVAGHSAASITRGVYLEEDESRITNILKEIG